MKNQSKECACAHDHPHGRMGLLTRWLLSILMVGLILIVLRPFLIGQMLVRVTSYATYAYAHDAIRICQRIIAMDKNNKQAWSALGFAYMDLPQVDRAIAAFKEVLVLNPQDKGAASFELGQAYFLKKDFPKAIGYFQRVRSAGPRSGVLLDADILKYRHGVLGFQSVHSMGSLLSMLSACYTKTGDSAQAAQVQKEYDFYQKAYKITLF